MGAPKRKAMRPKAPGSMARQRGEKPRGQKSCTPSSATGTIGTRRCRERMGAPFLNFFGAPSIERSPKKFKKGDRKSTRLNSSHLVISYAVFCLKKKKKN